MRNMPSVAPPPAPLPAPEPAESPPSTPHAVVPTPATPTTKNGCLKKRGGCHRRASCQPDADGKPICTCIPPLKGDGKTCSLPSNPVLPPAIAPAPSDPGPLSVAPTSPQNFKPSEPEAAPVIVKPAIVPKPPHIPSGGGSSTTSGGGSGGSGSGRSTEGGSTEGGSGGSRASKTSTDAYLPLQLQPQVLKPFVDNFGRNVAEDSVQPKVQRRSNHPRN